MNKKYAGMRDFL